MGSSVPWWASGSLLHADPIDLNTLIFVIMYEVLEVGDAYVEEVTWQQGRPRQKGRRPASWIESQDAGPREAGLPKPFVV